MEIEKSKVLIHFLSIFRQSGDVLFFLYARRLRGYTATVIQNGLLVYGCTNKTSLHPIYQAQKRFVRAIFFMKNCDSVSGHFKNFNLLTVYELHIQSLLRQYFEERTGNSPSIFLKAKLPEQHIMKTRRTKLNCLMPKITRTLIMRNSLETRLLRIHN